MAKSTKSTKSAKSAKAAVPQATKGKLNKSSGQVLGALVKAKVPMTRRQIADAVAKADKAANLIGGRIAQETKTYAALLESGLVKNGEVAGTSDDSPPKPAYSITPAGRKALGK